MENYFQHERGRYKPVKGDEPLPNDDWPYHGHPQTPFDHQFGIKNPKYERHIFIRKDQYMCDIDSQLQIVAMSRRDPNGTEDDRMTSATTQFESQFCRWIDKHIGLAKARMQSFVLEKHRSTSMNSIKDKDEIDIELLMPEWWDGTVFEQLTNAVHDYIVNSVLKEYFILTLTSKDPVTIEKSRCAEEAFSDIRKFSNSAKPGRIRKPLKPF